MNKVTDKELKLLISKRLNQLKQQSGKTVEQTAEDLDIDYSQYFNLLRGKRLAKLTTLVNIANAYDLELDWFVREKTGDKIRGKVNTWRLLSGFNKLSPEVQDFVLKVLDSVTRKKPGRSD
ncbi:MAG: helix-turn-helix domain-containing protein [Candidatus Margulisbacteria bacterium]|jgi:transcriptional regulator with XRE-family HTH domain|nr:helix-turn-helix domain-containing protein [Candidatus Margulisiibacteriota bacterium]